MARRVVKRRLTTSYSADDPERIEVSQSGYGNMVRDLRAAELFRVCSRISGKKRRSLCRLLPASAKRGLASKAPASEFVVYLYIDYVSRACYDGHPCSSRGVFRRRSIGGARCGVLRLRLVTAPREVRGPARQALRLGCEELAARAAEEMLQTEARPPAINRHGGAPKGARPTLLDAGRLASARTRRVMVRPTGCRCTRAPIGAPPPLGVGLNFKTRAQLRRGNEICSWRGSGPREWAV